MPNNPQNRIFVRLNVGAYPIAPPKMCNNTRLVKPVALPNKKERILFL